MYKCRLDRSKIHLHYNVLFDRIPTLYLKQLYIFLKLTLTYQKDYAKTYVTIKLILKNMYVCMYNISHLLQKQIGFSTTEMVK